MKFYKLASNDAAIINLEDVREICCLDSEQFNTRGEIYSKHVLRVTFKDGSCHNYEYDFTTNAEADIDGIMMSVDGLYNDDNNEETE